MNINKPINNNDIKTYRFTTIEKNQHLVNLHLNLTHFHRISEGCNRDEQIQTEGVEEVADNGVAEQERDIFLLRRDGAENKERVENIHSCGNVWNDVCIQAATQQQQRIVVHAILQLLLHDVHRSHSHVPFKHVLDDFQERVRQEGEHGTTRNIANHSVTEFAVTDFVRKLGREVEVGLMDNPDQLPLLGHGIGLGNEKGEKGEKHVGQVLAQIDISNVHAINGQLDIAHGDGKVEGGVIYIVLEVLEQNRLTDIHELEYQC